MAALFDEWRPCDLLIEALRICGGVLLIGGVVLALLGVLGGSREPLEEPLNDFGLMGVLANTVSSGLCFTREFGRFAGCSGGASTIC